MILNKVKSHYTQSVRKNSVHKLLFSHVRFLETQCSYIIIKTHEITVSIIHLYILLNRDNGRISIQFTYLKLNPLPVYNLFWQVLPFGLSPLEMKKTLNPLKKIF